MADVRHKSLDDFIKYLRSSGLEVAGPMEWVDDPQHPGWQIPRIPVRPRKEAGHVKPGEQLAAAVAG